VTGPGGSYREGGASRHEAAGGRPTSGVNAVYDARVVPGQGAAPVGETVPAGVIVPVGVIVLADGETAGRESGPASPSRGRSWLGRSWLARSGLGSSRRGRSGRGRSWRVAFFGLALAGLVGFGTWALFGSQLLAVRSVVVTGTHLVPAAEVLAVAGVEPGTPLIRVNAGQVAARIETIRQIRGVRVTRSWPDRVVIVVLERTPALAVTAQGGGFDLVDADGVIVRWAASRPAGLPLYPVITAVASLRGDPDLGAAAAVLGELPARLRHSVESVAVPSPDQVTLELSGGITVVWGGTDRPAQKAQELTVLMATHSHYYDVSAQGTLMTK
jgi:cell division protein FtsQ